VVSNNLVSEDGYVLLGKRVDNGLWATPGGKVENESLVDAAKREQLEETGMTLLGEPEIAGVVDCFGMDGVHHFVCVQLVWRNWLGFPRNVEQEKCHGWQWFSVAELPSDLSPATGKFLPGFLQKNAVAVLDIDASMNWWELNNGGY
jgi:8-oxo-dGTP diphosphatase